MTRPARDGDGSPGVPGGGVRGPRGRSRRGRRGRVDLGALVAAQPRRSYDPALPVRARHRAAHRDLAALDARSLSQILDVRRSDQSFSTDILNDGGYVPLAWDLVGGATSRPLDCSPVAGLASILAVSTSVTDAHRVYEDRRLCDDHAGVSEGLLHGADKITIDAMAGEKSLGTAMTLTHPTIAGQNRGTDLGAIAIPIKGL